MFPPRTPSTEGSSQFVRSKMYLIKRHTDANASLNRNSQGEWLSNLDVGGKEVGEWGSNRGLSREDWCGGDDRSEKGEDGEDGELHFESDVGSNF